MKAKLFCVLFMGLLVAVATINVNRNTQEVKPLVAMALENLNALANGEGGTTDNPEGGMQTIYKRHTNDCWIYGNGKISIVGGGFIEVKGSLCLKDYQVSCEQDGTSSCKNIECAEIWGWVD